MEGLPDIGFDTSFRHNYRPRRISKYHKFLHQVRPNHHWEKLLTRCTNGSSTSSTSTSSTSSTCMPPSIALRSICYQTECILSTISLFQYAPFTGLAPPKPKCLGNHENSNTTCKQFCSSIRPPEHPLLSTPGHSCPLLSKMGVEQPSYIDMRSQDTTVPINCLNFQSSTSVQPNLTICKPRHHCANQPDHQIQAPP